MIETISEFVTTVVNLLALGVTALAGAIATSFTG